MYDYVGAPDWRKSSLYDLAEWRNGLAFKNIDFAPVGRPVIKIAELKNGVTDQTARTMAEYDPSVFVRNGDMLFSWSGNPDTSIDVFRWRGEDGWLNQHIFKLTPNADVSEDFFFFLLRWLRPRFAEIARNKQTTGLGHVTGRDLREISVGVPDRAEQDAIVEIVGPIEQKIELNRRTNETLEAVARAIFRDWFIDFGPTRRKMAGAQPYLQPDLWQLFPDQLDCEGKPQGWQNLFFGELLSGSIGGDWGSESARGDDNLPVHIIRGTDIPDVNAGGVGKAPTRFTTSKKLASRRLSNDDIVIEVSGGSPTQPTGRSLWISQAMLDRFEHPVVCASFCRRLRPKNTASGYIAAMHLSNLYSQGGTWEYQNQSTGIANFQTTHFLGAEQVIWPSEKIADAFISVIAPLRQLRDRNENIALVRARDLLLPKLMSGEIRLRDAERALEDVA